MVKLASTYRIYMEIKGAVRKKWLPVEFFLQNMGKNIPKVTATCCEL